MDAAVEIIENKQKELCPVGRYSRNYLTGLDREKYDEWEDLIYVVNSIPTVNAEPVVRCGECKHARESEEEFDWDGTPLYRCGYCKLPNRRHEYCSWGERKTE